MNVLILLKFLIDSFRICADFSISYVVYLNVKFQDDNFWFLFFFLLYFLKHQQLY